MGIRIITDSASDISQERAKEWDVTVMPLTVRFHEEEYLDGVTITPLEFYEKLVETDELPKTSQITPYRYEEEFRGQSNMLLPFLRSFRILSERLPCGRQL